MGVPEGGRETQCSLGSLGGFPCSVSALLATLLLYTGSLLVQGHGDFGVHGALKQGALEQFAVNGERCRRWGAFPYGR